MVSEAIFPLIRGMFVHRSGLRFSFRALKVPWSRVSVCGRHYEEGEMSESTMYETIWELIYNGKVLCVCVSSARIRGPFDKNE